MISKKEKLLAHIFPISITMIAFFIGIELPPNKTIESTRPVKIQTAKSLEGIKPLPQENSLIKEPIPLENKNTKSKRELPQSFSKDRAYQSKFSNTKEISNKEDVYAQPFLPQKLPKSGIINVFGEHERIAPFGIKASQSNHFFIKLVNAYNKKDIMTIFVREGEEIKVDVPLGVYEIKYACGNTWYGKKYLFGPETAYYKAEQLLNFYIMGDKIRGYTITLYKVSHGNLHTSKINAEDF